MAFRLRSRNPRPVEVVEFYPDDPTVYEPIKYLGVFAVQHITPDITPSGSKRDVPITKIYKQAGIIDREDESVLELHLRRDVPLQDAGGYEVRRSLGTLARYVRLQRERMQPTEIIGITDPVLGRVASHFGFEIHDMNAAGIPLRMHETMQRYNNRLAPAHQDIGAANFRPGNELNQTAREKYALELGRLVVVHQDTNDFLQRFDAPVEAEGIPLTI